MVSHGQQPARMRRIGILMQGVQTDPLWQQRLAAFRQELEGLGWQEKRNVNIEVRYSGNDYDRLPQLAHEIVTLNPDVIFTNTTPAIKALQRETRVIPLIFVEVSDPAGANVVASLARPGGNITGFLFYEDSILGKWLGMLKEIAPHLTRVALLGNPKGFPYGYFLRTAKSIAPSLGIEVIPAPVVNADEIERSIVSFAHMPNGGLLAPNDSTVEANRDVVIALAARYRLPAVYAFRDFVTAGGLM
jgi:putative ABC transport system substrate-binding protein